MRSMAIHLIRTPVATSPRTACRTLAAVSSSKVVGGQITSTCLPIRDDVQAVLVSMLFVAALRAQSLSTLEHRWHTQVGPGDKPCQIHPVFPRSENVHL